MGILQFIEQVCVQTAVYWAKSTSDGFGGYAYVAPVEVDVRWAEKVQMVTDSSGKQVVSTSEVLVQQDMDLDGLLYLGELTDLTPLQLADPTNIEDVREIKAFSKVPLLKSTTEFVRTAFLAKRML